MYHYHTAIVLLPGIIEYDHPGSPRHAITITNVEYPPAIAHIDPTTTNAVDVPRSTSSRSSTAPTA